MSGVCTIWNGNGSIVAAGTPGGRQSSPVPASRSVCLDDAERFRAGLELRRRRRGARCGRRCRRPIDRACRRRAEESQRSRLPRLAGGAAAVVPATVTVTVRVVAPPGPVAVKRVRRRHARVRRGACRASRRRRFRARSSASRRSRPPSAASHTDRAASIVAGSAENSRITTGGLGGGVPGNPRAAALARARRERRQAAA